ncbi:MAG TPA: TRZ/ATZ family hydrolase, partial [Methylophilaceae bacterium]|nr:TRZ/ATZ family hydrolase [Methylophilaceae bacterium]
MTEHTFKETSLAIEARWVVPVSIRGQVLERATVILDQGRILDVLPTELARQRYLPQQTISLDDHVLIPGLI